MDYNDELEMQTYKLAKAFAYKYRKYAFLYNNDYEEYIDDIAVKGITKLNQYDKSKGKLSSWLYEVFLNHIKCKIKLKNPSRYYESYIEETFKDFENTYSYKDDFTEQIAQRDYTEKFFEKLTKIKKVNPLVCEYYLDGKTYRQLANKYGISYQAIQAKVKNSLKKIRKELENEK